MDVLFDAFKNYIKIKYKIIIIKVCLNKILLLKYDLQLSLELFDWLVCN